MVKEMQGNNKPVLTKLAYDNRFQRYAGFGLFPLIPHSLNVGQIAKFKEKFKVYDSRRALGGKSLRVADMPDDFVQFKIDERAYERPVDDREWKNALDPMRAKMLLESSKLKYLQNLLGLEMEVLQANLATDITKYDSNHRLVLSGTDMFDNSSSHPLKIIKEAKIAAARGANVKTMELTCLMSEDVYSALTDHPDVLATLSSNERKLMSEDIMRNILDVQNLYVGTARGKIAGEIENVWGNSMIFAYVPKQIESLEDAAFGATVRQETYPIVRSYRDEGADSDVLKYKDALQPVIIDSGSGFLLSNVVS